MKEIQCFDYDNNAGLINVLDLFAVKLEQSTLFHACRCFNWILCLFCKLGRSPRALESIADVIRISSFDRLHR